MTTTTHNKSQTTSSPIFQWRSLKTRVTIFTLAIFLLGIWSMALYSSRMLRDDMQHLLGEQQFSAVSFMAAQVNQELDDRLRLLQNVAGSIRPAMLDNTAALQALLEQHPMLQSLFNGGAFITRLDGTATASIPISIERIGVNYMDRDFIISALTEGKATIGRPVTGKKLLAPVFSIGVPIHDTQGKVIGALAGTTNLGMPNFMDKFTENRYGKSGGFFLMAPQYRLIVTASDKSRIMEVLPAPGIIPGLDQFMHGYEGSAVYVNPRGVEVLGSGKSIPLAGWYMGAILPTKEAFSPIHAMMQRILLATISFTLFAGVLTWGMVSWMLRRQLSPMLTATRTLVTLAKTDHPPQPLHIARQDEIGELIGGFNRLLETLRQREEALKESNELFSLFMSHSPIYTYIKEVTPTQSIVLQASDNFVQMIGILGSEMAGKTMMELFSPELAAKITADDWAVVSRGEVLRVDEELNGRSYTTIKFPIVQKDKTLLAGYTIDITDRKQAEEELRRLSRQNESILSSAAEGILGLDLQGTHTFVNPAAASMLGYEVEELLGRPSHSTWHHTRPDGTPYPKEDCKIRASYQDGVTRKVSTEVFWRKDGTSFPVEYMSTPIHAQNRVAGVVVTFTDITERKQAEQEKENLQVQLLQSQKIEAIGQLAGGIAHDFNNMLGVILGHTEIALDQVNPGQPLHADLQEIRKAAERSSDLTRQLLTFARKQTIAPKVVDLNEMVEGMFKMLRRLIGEDLHLAWLPGVNIWPIMIDPSQIDQILANLCVNARDAIAGVGKVTIETENITFDEDCCAGHTGLVPGDYVLLGVSDDGCGMDKEILGRLFEPFFTTKGVGKGTGLGLATCYGIVKQNNGFINVYSEPDQGTTFKIYLPRYIGTTEQTMIKETPEIVARGHETVLVVEDESALLDLSKIMLEGQGYRVLVAGTPDEAIQLAKEHTGEIHLLMTDVVMPEMNGRDLSRKMLSLYPDLKCLFMSGYTANVIAHHGILDERIHFIQKPFSRKGLTAKVREVLDQK